MKITSLLSAATFAVGLILFTPAASATPIHSTFGPDDSYEFSGGPAIGGQEVAARFVGVYGTLTFLRLAGSHFSGVNDYTVSLAICLTSAS